MLVTGGEDKIVKIWTWEWGENSPLQTTLLHTLSSFTLQITDLEFSPDGAYLAVASGAPEVQVFNTSDWSLAYTALGYSPIGPIAFSGDGARLVGGAHSVIVVNDESFAHFTIWDAATGERLARSSEYAIGLDLAYTPDGSLIITASDENNTLQIWDGFTGELLRTLTGHTARIVAIAISPDGALLASASADGTIILWGIP